MIWGEKRQHGWERGMWSRRHPGKWKTQCWEGSTVFRRVFARSWSTVSFFRKNMSLWFSSLLCSDVTVTDFLTAHGQMLVRTLSSTLHLMPFLSSLITAPIFLYRQGHSLKPADCILPPDTVIFSSLSFLGQRKQLPTVRNSVVLLKCFVCLFLFTGNLIAKAENFHWISSVFWSLIFVNLVLLSCDFSDFVLHAYLLRNCKLGIMKFLYMSINLVGFFHCPSTCNLWSFFNMFC